MTCPDGTLYCGVYRKKHPKWTYMLKLAEPDAAIRRLSAEYMRSEYGLQARDKPAEGLMKAYGKQMATELKSYGPFGHHAWRVPTYALDSRTASYWLSSYFDGDGDVSVSDKPSGCIVRARSVNRLGLLGVKGLLRKYFGIDAKLYFHGAPRLANWSKSYDLNIAGALDIERFAKLVGFNHPSKSRKLDQIREMLRSKESASPNHSTGRSRRT